MEGDASHTAALLTMALKGVAAEYIVSLPRTVLMNDGIINGNAADPLIIMHSLAERFSLVGEEVCMSSFTDLFHFKRNLAANEKVDELIARFELMRQRARDQDQLTISIPGLCWPLLGPGVTDSQLLARTNGRMPVTEEEFAALKRGLKLAQAMHTWPKMDTQQGWGSSGLGSSGWADSSAAAEPANAWWTDMGSGTDTVSTDTAAVEETVISQETPDGLTDEAAVGEYLFWAHTRAKAQWRKFMGRPTRAVRRFTHKFISRKRKGGQRKGASKYFGHSDFLA